MKKTGKRLAMRTIVFCCVVAAALFVPVVSAFGEGSNEMVVAVPGEPPTLHPSDGCSYTANFVTDNIYERLTRREADGTVVGWLAESFSQVNDLTWRFKLRKGITFTNGEPFNADAVVTVMGYYIKEGTRCYGDYSSITGVEKVDEYTVDFKTEALDPTVPRRLLKFYVIAPKWMTDTPEAELAVSAVGTGPYKLVEWEKGRHVLLEANNDYWGDKKPTVQTIRLVPREEAAVRASMIRAGEADIAINISQDQADPLPKSVTEHTTEAVFIRVNTQHPVMQDIRVRKAIALSIDTEKLMNTLYKGVSSGLNNHIVRSSALGYNPDLKPYPYDPAEASRLVKEAGATGAEIELIIRTDQFANASELGEAVQGMINESGLDVKIVAMEAGPWRELLFANKPGQERTDLNIIAASNTRFDSSRVINFYFGMGQFCHADSAEFQVKLDNAAQQIGSARVAAYQQLWKEIAENYWVVPLFGMDFIHGLSDRVEWEPRDDGFVYFNTVTIDE